MMSRVYNFGAGPATLPESILKEAQEEFLNWNNTGMSILEIGHRTDEFMALMQHAQLRIRELLGIPNNYKVLFLGGAARTQFAMVPMNLLKPKQQAGYIVSGVWSKMALQEAERWKSAYCVATNQAQNYNTIPEQHELVIKENSSYIYYTPNETVNGVRFPYLPKTQSIPLIADMTSCLLSEPLDIKQYGLIFAGAQKNIANAGLTLVIVNEDLLHQDHDLVIPTMFDYKIQAENDSLYATPPVLNCYLASKMFDWVKEQGGVDVMFAQNCRKAALLYQYIDSSDFYTTQVSPEARSIMNVCFSIREKKREAEFLQLAKQRGLCALQGHRLVGGLRASLYNAMPIEGVEQLIHFMMDFAKEHP